MTGIVGSVNYQNSPLVGAMAAWTRTPATCDIVTSQTRAGPLKMDEHKRDEHENIKKKVDIFQILNGIVAKTRNLIS